MTLSYKPVRIKRFEIKLARVAVNLFLIAGLFSTKQAFAANINILSNPGFESETLINWTTYGIYNSVQISNANTAPHGGTCYYKVYGQFSDVTNYSGIYQDNLSAPSNTYTADGWTYTFSGDIINGQDAIWIEVSFRDASSNALALYRSVVVTSNNLASFGEPNTWIDLQITNQCSFTNASAQILLPGTVTNAVTSLVAPAGTAFVRYQVVFEQGPDKVHGSMYFDDLTLNQTGGTVVVVPQVLQWNIVWSDEFNGTSINRSNWTYDLGGGGWGNSEREYYTGRTNNAYVSNGLLHIVARQESTNGYSFTSARMKTQGLYTHTYGHFVWRAKLPAGVGMWPALWMLGANFPSVDWPDCGEIDTVETKGTAPATIQSSLHCGSDGTATYTFTGGDSSTNFHTYMMDWEPGSISFWVDGQPYETQTIWTDALGPYPVPFNAPFFIIMNLAVGGNYVGNPTINQINAGTVFPAEVQVDYVRVYQQTAPLAFSVGPQSNGSFTLSWPTNIVCHVQIQTNSFTGGTNWFDTSVTTSPFVVSPDPNNNCVFYRLQSP